MIDSLKRVRTLIPAFFLFWSTLLHAHSGNPQPIALSRLNGPITLDGIIDESAWQAIHVLPLVMYQPTYKGEMTQKTHIRVAYDENYIYMAGQLYDESLGKVRANSLYRDGYSGDDILAIVLDTFNDNENALWFFTNPLGTRFDASVSNDASGGLGSASFNWNSHWDVETTRTHEGWFVEMRIPFSSLRFQDEDGRVEMGLITYRYMSSRGERHIYPDIPPNWRMGMAKPSMAQNIVLEGVYSKKPVYFTPYVLGGLDKVNELNEAETDYHVDTGRTNEIGLDVKYNLTSSMTLDATLNTDFAQVEADDQRVNLTRFSLFFPEKRQFFQERAGLFEFSLGDSDRLFHSRRIGLDDGEPIRLLGGARLVGRLNTWDLGIINMQTAAGKELPAENFAVMRVRRQILNQFSTLGGMLTSRIGKDGDYNIVLGLDALVRPFGDEYVALKLAQSLDKTVNKNANPAETGRLYLSWQRRHLQGLSYSTEIAWAGPDFVPAMGFERREDFSFLRNEVQFQRFMNGQSMLRSIRVQNEVRGYLRNADGRVESGLIRPALSFESKTGANLQFNSMHSYEDISEAFSLSDSVDVPVGTYWFHEARVQFRAARGWLFRPGLTVSMGQFYDGTKTEFRLEPGWNLSSHLELQGLYSFSRVKFDHRGQKFDAHIARLRIKAALDNRLSCSAFLQFSNVSDLISINARLRYHFREGNDLWLVYDEGLNTERDLADGRILPRTDNRTLLLKYTYTLIR